jgi:hypothetical protein
MTRIFALVIGLLTGRAVVNSSTVDATTHN